MIDNSGQNTQNFISLIYAKPNGIYKHYMYSIYLAVSQSPQTFYTRCLPTRSSRAVGTGG